MLDIRINDTPLDLPPGATLNIVATNPILDRDNVGRQFSYPFRVPVTPSNRRARLHGQRLDAKKISAKRPGAIRYQTHLLAAGYVTQTQISDSGEEIIFANQVLDLWKELSQFKISEILDTLGVGNTVYTEAVWTYAFTESYPNTYSISIEGGPVATASAANAGELDAAIASIASQINAVQPGMSSYFPGIPKIELLSSAINQYPVTGLVSVTLESAVTLADKNYANAVAYVTGVNATPIDEICFPCIVWNDLYTDPANYPFLGIANYFVDGTFKANTPATSRVWYNTIIPCVRVPYILEKIRERIGFTAWRGDIFEGEAIQQLIVVSNYTLDDVRYDRYPTGVGVGTEFLYHNSFKTEINLNRHVPELSAADFIRAICTNYNLMLEYADGALRFTPKRNKLTPTAFDLTTYINMQYALERNYADGWTLRQKPNDREEFNNLAQLQPLVSAGGEILTEVPASFAYTTGFTLEGGQAKLPITQQPGVSDAYDGSKARSSLPLTLLFYRGLALTSTAKEYPFATHDNLDLDDNPVGEYSLDINADTAGLYALWHKGYIELSNADTIRIGATLPIGAIQKILAWRAARARFYHPDGAINAVFKSLEFSISNAETLAPVRIEMLVQQ